MASDRNTFLNTLNSKIVNLEQFNRTDNRFKFDVEYLRESSNNIDTDNDLIIESSNNNIKFLVNTTKNFEFFGDSKFNNNVDIFGNTNVENINVNGNLTLSNNINLNSNAFFTGDVLFESNVDVSGTFTVNGIDTYSRTLTIENSILEYIPLTDGNPTDKTLYEIILDLCNNPIISNNINNNLNTISDNSISVAQTSAIKQYIKYSDEIPSYYDLIFYKNDNYKTKNITIKKNQYININSINIVNNFPLYHFYTFGNSKKNMWISSGKGSSNTLALSTNFYNWGGLNTTLLGQIIYKVYFNGRIWVAVGIGINDTIIYSFNGIIWYSSKSFNNTSKSLFSVRAYDVTYDNGLWVAVGTNLTYGMIAYSYDGINWNQSYTINNTSIENLFSIQTLGIKWCGYRWIAIGEGINSIAYSYDAIKWIGLGNSLITKPEAIHFNGYRIVIVGSVGTYKIIYSDDYGLTWKGTNNKPSLFENIYNINFYDNIWVACGSYSNDVSSGVIYSYNAKNWLYLNNSSLIDFSNNYYNNIEWDGDNMLIMSQLLNSNNNGYTLKYNNNIINDSWENNSSLSSILNTGINSIQKNIFNENHIILNDGLMYICGQSSNFTLAYSYNGINWYDISNSLFTKCNSITFNGNIYVAVGYGQNTISISRDGLKWYGLGTSIFSIEGNFVIWDNNIFIALGEGTNTIAYSFDGINWYGSNNIFSIKGNCAIYFKNKWFVGGEGTNTLAYSDDGINWINLGSSILNTQVFSFATNGNILVMVGGNNVSIAYSYNGLNWISVSSSILLLPIARDIYWNNLFNMWIVVGNGNNNRIIYTYNLIDWFNISNGNSIFSISANSIVWNGYLWVATGEGTNNVAYSYDGITWQKYSLFSNLGLKIVNIKKPKYDFLFPIISLGSGTHSIAYSIDGFNWEGLTTNIFTETKGIYTNGKLWIIGGSGNNTMAYSYDGYNWIANGSNIFSIKCNTISWNGNLWVAGGQGINNMAYSYDGINWTINNLNNMTNIIHIGWNGNRFIACGSGINKLAYSDNGINWTFVSNSSNIFNTEALNVIWMFNKWIAVGKTNNSIAYSIDNGITWTGIGNSIFNVAYDIAYNGYIGVAVGEGTNVIAYTYDGIIWTGLGKNNLTNIGYGIKWTGKMFIVGGNSDSQPDKSRLLISYDGINWFRHITPHTINCFRIETINDIEYGPKKAIQYKQINYIKELEVVSNYYNNSSTNISFKTETIPNY